MLYYIVIILYPGSSTGLVHTRTRSQEAGQHSSAQPAAVQRQLRLLEIKGDPKMVKEKNEHAAPKLIKENLLKTPPTEYYLRVGKIIDNNDKFKFVLASELHCVR